MNPTTRNDENSEPENPPRDAEAERASERGVDETPAGGEGVESVVKNAPFDNPPERPLEFAQYAPPPKPFGAILAGGVAGAVLSAAMLWYFLPSAAISPEVARRLTALEGASGSSAGLEERLASLESAAALQANKMAGISAFGPRLSALEAAAPEAKAVAEMSKSALSEAQAARAEAAKAIQAADKPQGDAAAAPPALDAGALTRLDKLESSLAALGAAQPNLAPINDRLAKPEAALAAPKSAERVAAEPAPPRSENPAMLAVAAQALGARVAAGAPYPLEQAALERLGADTGRLAELKPFARDGAPSLASLANEFAKITPALLSAAEPKSDDGIMARLMANMGKIVRVRPVGEQAGDEPAAVVSQIGAALGRADAAGALAAFARLPDASREAGKEWAAKARARVAAAAAAQALLDDSLTRLGGAKN